jgi:hypothetical protein
MLKGAEFQQLTPPSDRQSSSVGTFADAYVALEVARWVGFAVAAVGIALVQNTSDSLQDLVR